MQLDKKTIVIIILVIALIVTLSFLVYNYNLARENNIYLNGANDGAEAQLAEIIRTIANQEIYTFNYLDNSTGQTYNFACGRVQ